MTPFDRAAARARLMDAEYVWRWMSVRVSLSADIATKALNGSRVIRDDLPAALDLLDQADAEIERLIGLQEDQKWVDTDAMERERDEAVAENQRLRAALASACEVLRAEGYEPRDWPDVDRALGGES